MKFDLNKLILASIVIIWGLFFFFQEEKKEIEPKIEKKIVKKQVKEPEVIEKFKEEKQIVIKEEPKKQEIIEEVVEEIVEKQIELEQKKHVLYQTSSISHMHTIKLISNIKINNLSSEPDYISLEGNVVNPDGVDGRFSLSIRENYLEYLSDMVIEVEDKISKSTSNCDASFLIGIDKDGFYKFNYDSSSCYITEYKPESVFFKKMRANTNPVKLTEEQFKKLPKETQEKILKKIEEIKKTEKEKIN